MSQRALYPARGTLHSLRIATPAITTNQTASRPRKVPNCLKEKNCRTWDVFDDICIAHGSFPRTRTPLNTGPFCFYCATALVSGRGELFGPTLRRHGTLADSEHDPSSEHDPRHGFCILECEAGVNGRGMGRSNCSPFKHVGRFFLRDPQSVVVCCRYRPQIVLGLI